MKLFVVIPNWNGADFISDCIKSLANQSTEAEIVVVDNGSMDGSVELIEERFPKITLIKNSTNLGFAGGVNTGIVHALKNEADAIALFNNDAVADKHWLENLSSALESDSSVGIVTCKLLRTGGTHIDSTGDFYTIWGMPFPRGRNKPAKGNFEKREYIFGASGGASLYSAKMLSEIGLFDEKFFAYFEDVDISFRAQLAGWKVLYEPSAYAYHRVSATTSKLGSFSRYHSVKNFFLLYTKNMPGWLYFKYLPLFSLHALRFAVSSTLRGGLAAYLRGVWSFARWLPVVLKERKEIQKNRKVSISYIDSTLVHSLPPRIPPIDTDANAS